MSILLAVLIDDSERPLRRGKQYSHSPHMNTQEYACKPNFNLLFVRKKENAAIKPLPTATRKEQAKYSLIVIHETNVRRKNYKLVHHVALDIGAPKAYRPNKKRTLLMDAHNNS